MMNLGQIKEGAGTRTDDAPFYPINPARWRCGRGPAAVLPGRQFATNGVRDEKTLLRCTS
jgi:hypothetical protein